MTPRTLAAVAMGALLTGCLGPWQDEWNLVETGTLPDTDLIGPTGDTGQVGATVVITESITTDTEWTADNTYILDDLIYVEGTSTLRIEAGTQILGNNGSAMVVTRDARIEARGTASEPIVFTSSQPVGERAAGDWGGLVLLGNAPNFKTNPVIEGVPADDPRGNYGGNDETSNCGVLDFVRVEYAGFEAFAGNELNGLTLGSCGYNSVIRNVQVHTTVDDGVEVFGGTVDLKNILITRAGDDSLDWDQGWTGRVQFLIVQQWAEDGDNIWETDSDADGDLPVSDPTIYNATLVGSGDPLTAQRGILHREGTRGTIRNLIVAHTSEEGVDIGDALTAGNALSGELSIDFSIFFDNGAGGTEHAANEPTDGSDEDDDDGFVESVWLVQQGPNNLLGTDPQLPPLDWADPSWVPASSSPALAAGAAPPDEEFFDQSADYIGAVRPGEPSPWYEGWTAFPDQ